MSIEQLPFDLPFEEAAAFFGRKIPLSEEQYSALSAWAKRRAFTVAEVTKAEVLQDLMDAAELGVADGVTLADFLASLDDIMATRGWEGTTPWHAENVLRTSLQQSYGAGRLNQQRAQSDDFPFWWFRAVLDDRTTDECEELDGTVFSIDDVEWYPPIWYECRSHGEPLTEYEAEELGGPTDGSDLPEANGFAGPGAGDEYDPDLSGFDDELAGDVRATIDGFDPNDFEV